METRQKLKSIEKDIIVRLQEEDDLPARKVFKRLVEFYELYDIKYGSNHLAIIHAIYVSKDYENKTVVWVAIQNSVSESTLCRYRRDYVRSFTKLYELIYPDETLFRSA